MKAEDPTFEPSALSLVERWKVYVSAYETVEPTLTFRYNRSLEFPFLRRGVRQQFGEDQPSDSNIADMISESTENLEFRIQQGQKYRLEFSPHAYEYAISKKVEVSRSAVDEEAAKRGATAAEKFEYNSSWMEGKSADEVDQYKQAYQAKL